MNRNYLKSSQPEGWYLANQGPKISTLQQIIDIAKKKRGGWPKNLNFEEMKYIIKTHETLHLRLTKAQRNELAMDNDQILSYPKYLVFFVYKFFLLKY